MPNKSYHRLEGHLGADPVIGFTTNGKEQARLNMAVNSGTKERPETEWWSVFAYSKGAIAQCRGMSKGDSVMVEAESCRASIYKDKAQLSVTSFNVYHINWHKVENTDQGSDNSQGSQESSYPTPPEQQQQDMGLGADDPDLPF